MFLPSREQKVLNSSFDTLLSNTADALQNPAIAEELGQLSGQLYDINETAFVPNIRNGRFSLPRRQRNNNNLAVVPLDESQAEYAFQLIDPLFDGFPGQWRKRDVGLHNTYGITGSIHRVANAFITGTESGNNNHTLNGLHHHAEARTQALFNAPVDGKYYSGSRPIVMIRDRILDESPYAQAGTMAHEEVHAIDIQADGPMYMLLDYGASSELRAYHTSSVIYQNDPEMNRNIMPSRIHLAHAIESDRQQANNHTNYPFKASGWLLDCLIERGVV